MFNLKKIINSYIAQVKFSPFSHNTNKKSIPRLFYFSTTELVSPIVGGDRREIRLI